MTTPIHPYSGRTFTIDRRTWYRGHGSQESSLLRPDGFQCCLGQVARACSIPDHRIRNQLGPISADWPEMTFAGADGRYDRRVADLMLLNDSMNLTAPQREAALIAKAAELGITLVFAN